MDRIVILTDFRAPDGLRLTAASVVAAARRDDMKVVAIVPTERDRAMPRGRRASMARRLRQLFAIAAAPARRKRGTVGAAQLQELAQEHGIDILRPPGCNVNDRSFVDTLRHEHKPTILLSLYCQQIFGPALLATANRCVNYHNGYLPAYRGLRASCWSIYNGETSSGYSFHYMNAGIDEGNVLISGGVPITAAVDAQDLEGSKTAAALECVPRLLAMLAAGEPGEAQDGGAHYYSRQDAQALVLIEQPGALTSTELARRMRAFGGLKLRLEGELRWVSGLEILDGTRPDPAHAFACADGQWVRPLLTKPRPRKLRKFLRSLERRLVGG